MKTIRIVNFLSVRIENNHFRHGYFNGKDMKVLRHFPLIAISMAMMAFSIPVKILGQVFDLEGMLVQKNTNTPVTSAEIAVYDKFTQEVLFRETSDPKGHFSIRVPASERIRLRVSEPAHQIVDLGFRELNQLYLADDPHIEMVPLAVNRFRYSIASTIPFSGPANLRIEDLLSGETVHAGVLENDGTSIPITLDCDRSYLVSIQSPEIFSGSWQIEQGSSGQFQRQESISIGKRGVEVIRSEGGEWEVTERISPIPATFNAVMEVPGIRFTNESVYLDPSSLEALIPVIQIIQDQPELIFEIGHHSNEYNDRIKDLDLSQKRAEVILDIMIELADLPSERIAARGYGNMQLQKICPGAKKCNDHIGSPGHIHSRTDLKVIGKRQHVKVPAAQDQKMEAKVPVSTKSGAFQQGKQPGAQLRSDANADLANYSGKAIQLMLTSRPLPAEHKLKSDPLVREARLTGDRFAYIALPQTGERDLAMLLSDYRKQYGDAFIVSYYNGNRIP